MRSRREPVRKVSEVTPADKRRAELRETSIVEVAKRVVRLYRENKAAKNAALSSQLRGIELRVANNAARNSLVKLDDAIADLSIVAEREEKS